MKAAGKRLPAGFAALMLCAAGAGCSSTAADAGSARGPVNSGTYPNLNVPPPVATEPFDRESLRAHREAVGGARAAQRQEGNEAAALAAASRAEAARLRRLAALQAAKRKAIEQAD